MTDGEQALLTEIRALRLENSNAHEEIFGKIADSLKEASQRDVKISQLEGRVCSFEKTHQTCMDEKKTQTDAAKTQAAIAAGIENGKSKNWIRTGSVVGVLVGGMFAAGYTAVKVVSFVKDWIGNSVAK